MKKHIIALFLILGPCVTSVKAGVFVEIGQSVYDKPMDTLWYQEAYPYDFDHRDSYFRIGYEIPMGGFMLRGSYFNLGDYDRNALATPEEDKYHAGECPAGCKAPDLYKTSGDVQGLLFSGLYQYEFFYVEAGAGYFRQTFSLSAEAIYPDSQFRSKVYFDGKEYAIGYMYGLGLQYKDFTLSFNVFLNNESSKFNEGVFPSGADVTRALAIGYRF